MSYIFLPIKWINKTYLFYFLRTCTYFIYLKTIILINKKFSPYLFNYKNLIIFLKLFLIYFTKNEVLHHLLLFQLHRFYPMLYW